MSFFATLREIWEIYKPELPVYACSSCGICASSKTLPAGWQEIVTDHYMHDVCPTHCPTCGFSVQGDAADVSYLDEHINDAVERDAYTTASCPTCRRFRHPLHASRARE